MLNRTQILNTWQGESSVKKSYYIIPSNLVNVMEDQCMGLDFSSSVLVNNLQVIHTL